MSAIAPTQGPVAVTGVSGFTGGHMVRELVHHGYHVRACLRDAGSWRGQDAIQFLERLPNVEIIDGCDLFEPGTYDAAFAGCVGVFHVAAVLGNSADGQSQPKGTGDVSTDVYEGGITGTQNVIDAVNASGSVKRLIYTSSMAAVRGPAQAGKPVGYEWTEQDWASDGVDPDDWQRPANAYARSKVDTEKLINAAADASNGAWDAITMNPAMICGPVLFKAQVGQWIEQIGRLAAGLEPTWPSKYDMYYDIIDVRDLAAAHRLAAESSIDHKNSSGGPRYVLHGSGGRSALRLGAELKAIVREAFPRFELGTPVAVTRAGESIPIEIRAFNDMKKTKRLLGIEPRRVEDTIRDVVETSIELGVITPTLES